MTAHALFIGINLYSDRSIPPLHCALRDAGEMYHLFKRELGYGAHAHLLDAPKQEDVYAKLAEIERQVRAGDSFLLYFAGHGVESADGQDQYLLLGGAVMKLLQTAQGTPAGTLSVRDLVAVTDDWPGVQRIMVFDACRTRLVPTMGLGQALHGLPVFGSEKVLQRIASRDFSLRRGQPAAGASASASAPMPRPPVFIKSCQSNQLALELLAEQRSMFGLAFDQVLKRARDAGQAVVTNPGLLHALAERMARLADQHGVGGGQQPWMSDTDTEAVLYLPRQAASPPPPPPEPPRPPADTALQDLLEGFERQLAAGQLDWPPEDCAVASLGLLRQAGLRAASLERYRERLAQAMAARKAEPAKPPPPPPPPPPPQRPAWLWPAAGMGGMALAAAMLLPGWIRPTPPAPSAATPAAPASAVPAAALASAAGEPVKAPAAMQSEPYPDVERLDEAALKALQRDVATRLGLGVVFRDRMADGQLGPEVVVVPAGRYTMGSNDGDADEKPPHGRRVAAFGLLKTEVTVGQYLACVAAAACREPAWREAGSKYHHQTGNDDYYRKFGAALTDANSPVVGVSWENARQYAAWLGAQTQQRYRLPSEAEWEFAARAGSKGAWSFGNEEGKLGEYAWFSANSGGRIHPVGGKRANVWDLHDMHGNVWEWVQDCYGGYERAARPETAAAWETGCEESRRVVRGGSWNNYPRGLRSAFRYRGGPDVRSSDLGFRLARTF